MYNFGAKFRSSVLESLATSPMIVSLLSFSSSGGFEFGTSGSGGTFGFFKNDFDYSFELDELVSEVISTLGCFLALYGLTLLTCKRFCVLFFLM